MFSRIPAHFFSIVLLSSTLVLVFPHDLPMHASINAPPASLVPNMVSVVTGTDGRLYANSFFNSTGTWGGWQSLSGASPIAPGLCQSQPGRVELVVEGYDGAIYHKSFINGTWSSTWDEVPTGATGDQPACAVLGTTMYMVVRGTNDEIWANSLDLTTGIWSPWTDLGGSTPSAPALSASPSINALDLVVRGEDNRIYHAFYASGSWSAWELPTCVEGNTGSIPSTPSTPAIVSGTDSTGAALVQVAIRNSGSAYDNQILSLLEYSGRSWMPATCQSWQTVGGQSINAPTLVSDPGGICIYGTLTALWRGLDGGIYLNQRCFATGPSWGGPGGSLGGTTGNRPAGAVDVHGQVGIVVSGTTKEVWYFQYGQGSSGLWTTMIGATNLDPTLVTVP